MAACASCARPLAGRYCSHCGEEAVEPHTLTVRHFVAHTLAHETLHLDGKIWRTLRYLILRPGFLTKEYCAGRRRLYVNPVRIFITAVIAYTLLAPGSGNRQFTVGPNPDLRLNIAPARISEGSSIESTVQLIDRFGLLTEYVVPALKPADLTSAEAQDKFHSQLHAFAQPLSFSNVLLLTLVCFAFFHRRQPLLVAHGVFSMHFMSFVLFSTLLMLWLPLRKLGQVHIAFSLGVVLAGILAQFVYLAVAIRRFYLANDRRRFVPGLVATASGILIYLLNSAFVTGIQMLGAALALWRVSRPAS
jgi:Protein of unknown function (DUF3667)